MEYKNTIRECINMLLLSSIRQTLYCDTNDLLSIPRAASIQNLHDEEASVEDILDYKKVIIGSYRAG